MSMLRLVWRNTICIDGAAWTRQWRIQGHRVLRVLDLHTPSPEQPSWGWSVPGLCPSPLCSFTDVLGGFPPLQPSDTKDPEYRVQRLPWKTPTAHLNRLTLGLPPIAPAGLNKLQVLWILLLLVGLLSPSRGMWTPQAPLAWRSQMLRRCPA